MSTRNEPAGPLVRSDALHGVQEERRMTGNAAYLQSPGEEVPSMKRTEERHTYGIGEWYGRLFTRLSSDERRRLARMQSQPREKRPEISCPFRSTPEREVVCSKEGGVCSLRKYQQTRQGVIVPEGPEGNLCTTCPSRFHEGEIVFNWIADTLLGCRDPIVLGETEFLQGPEGKAVGKIDNILVHPELEALQWCALEMQAVYFSGAAMRNEYQHLSRSKGEPLELPDGKRHPDYRSSGPKRLMPQLQIKVPTLRRWGKKMAIVVDESFFAAMGNMERVDDIWNGDIVWFVVGYDETETAAEIAAREFVVTTLESSVFGLTGGEPVSKEEFEASIRERVAREAGGAE